MNYSVSYKIYFLLAGGQVPMVVVLESFGGYFFESIGLTKLSLLTVPFRLFFTSELNGFDISDCRLYYFANKFCFSYSNYLSFSIAAFSFL